MSKYKALYHIVIATKYRKYTIPESEKKRLYAYIYSILQDRKCHLKRMNGISNHLHMLIDLNPTVALADLMRDIKQWSTKWAKDQPEFCHFEGWAKGYYAFTIGPDTQDAVIEYIKNQEEHHYTNFDFESELRDLAAHYGVVWHIDDLQ